MDESPISETLPGQYRAVLDAVSALERAGLRRDAGRIREDATRAYSRAWNATAQRRLLELEARATAMLRSRATSSRSARVPVRIPSIPRASG